MKIIGHYIFSSSSSIYLEKLCIDHLFDPDTHKINELIICQEQKIFSVDLNLEVYVLR